MKLKFQVIDRSQTGFARYCPGFARAYECAVDKITERRVKKTLEKLKCLEMDWAASKILVFAATKDIQTDEILSELALLFKNQNKPARVHMGRILLEIAQTEKNRARVIAIFTNALDNENPDIIETALDALKIRAEKDVDISAAMPKIAGKLEHDWNTKIRSDAAQLLKIIAEKKTDADFTVAIPKLIKRIKDEDASSRDSAAAALVSIATNNEQYRAGILNALIDAANDPVTGVMRTAIMSLRVASEKMDTSIAIPVFAKALKEGYFDNRLNAVQALSLVMEYNSDISSAIPGLFDIMLLNMAIPRDDIRLTEAGVAVLEKAAEISDQETRKAIAIEINKIIHSDWFGHECANYSEIFVQLVNYCARIMASARNTETNEMVEQA